MPQSQYNLSGSGGGGGSNTVDVEDAGTPLGSFDTINVTGAGATASNAGGGVAEINVPGGGSGIDAEDEGTPLGNFTTINFVGAGVTATNAGGGTLDVGVPGGGGGSGVTQTNAVYVSKAGNDANTGLVVGAPKLTIASAITAASGLSPSPTNRVTIWIQDGGTYTENVTLPSNVSLDGDGATVEGAISLGVRSRLRLHRVVYSAGSGNAVLFNAGFGDAWVDVDEIDRTGGGIFGAAIRGVFGGTSRLNLRVGRIIVSDSVALWADNGIITGSIDEIVITNAGYGVYVPNARVSLQIDSIRDTGSANIGVNIFASGTAFLFVGELNTNNTYTVAGTLNMFAGQITGTTGSITGTANVTVA